MARPVGRERVSELGLSRERLSLCIALGIFIKVLNLLNQRFKVLNILDQQHSNVSSSSPLKILLHNHIAKSSRMPKIIHIIIIKLELAESEKHVAMLITLFGKMRLRNKGPIAWRSLLFAHVDCG
ncbi:hypothetical protein YC2023_016494 [Brassica napus]